MTRILLVDDDLDIRANIQDILEAFDYQVATAGDGPAALDLAERQRFDVILLDYKMPGMNGVELYRRLRQIQPAAVAIMMTAYAGSEGVQRALDAGTWKVLRKPVDVDQLLGLITRTIQQPLVLVVDDDHEFCAALWDALRAKEIRVGIASNNRDAVHEAATGEYDIVLLDLALGVDKGEDVLDDLVSERVPSIVIITGQNPTREVTERLINQGAESVYRKPIDVEQIVQRIRRKSP